MISTVGELPPPWRARESQRVLHAPPFPSTSRTTADACTEGSPARVPILCSSVFLTLAASDVLSALAIAWREAAAIKHSITSALYSLCGGGWIACQVNAQILQWRPTVEASALNNLGESIIKVNFDSCFCWHQEGEYTEMFVSETASLSLKPSSSRHHAQYRPSRGQLTCGTNGEAYQQSGSFTPRGNLRGRPRQGIFTRIEPPPPPDQLKMAVFEKLSRPWKSVGRVCTRSARGSL